MTGGGVLSSIGFFRNSTCIDRIYSTHPDPRQVLDLVIIKGQGQRSTQLKVFVECYFRKQKEIYFPLCVCARRAFAHGKFAFETKSKVTFFRANAS